MSYPAPDGEWTLGWPCCEHCGCPQGSRTGHDDTCAAGCSDDVEPKP